MAYLIGTNPKHRRNFVSSVKETKFHFPIQSNLLSPRPFQQLRLQTRFNIPFGFSCILAGNSTTLIYRFEKEIEEMRRLANQLPNWVIERS